MTQHINPGPDTTINPVVIDDTYRSKHRQGIESGCIHECVCPDYKASCTDEDFPCSLPCINRYQDTSAPSQTERLCDDCNIIEIENKLTDTERQLIMAQQRVDGAIAYCNQRHFEVEDDDGTIYEVIPKGEIIALLQAVESGRGK